MSEQTASLDGSLPEMPLPSGLAEVIATQAAKRPDATALTFVGADGSGTSQTYAELEERSLQAANALLSAGVGRGDRVAVLAHNAPMFFELAFAVSRIGAALVGLNWRLAAPEIETIVADAAPGLLIVDPELADLAPAPGPVETVSTVDWAATVDAASSVDPVAAGRVAGSEPDDVVFILYTSGTTGVPKGAQLTNRNMAHSAWISGSAYGFTESSTNLVAMPLFHVGGMGYGLSAFFHGGRTVLRRDADPAAIVRDIATHRVTNAFFVPAVIQAILAVDGVEEADLSSLELLVYGAAPIGDAVLRRALAVLGCRFLQAYGMTETAGTIVALPPEAHDPDGPNAARLRSCGRPLPWVELRIVDPDSISGDNQPGGPVDAPVGQVGEIWTRSAQNTPGYRNRPEATAEAITDDGWLRTGDAAYADEDGYLFLFDRFKDMIVSGGENVYPAEVENVLYDHPDIAEVAVIGVPDQKWGETVKAIVVPVRGAAVGLDEVIELCRSRLAGFKCPTSVDIVESLPRNASGKVLKTQLRAPYWAGHDRRIA
jgi:long-chain acyl-CoA synthetase